MNSFDHVLLFYSRIDAFGDGLLRLPALRAARTAFPQSRIVYASSGPSTLEKLLRRHVERLVDDIRVKTPLDDVLAEIRRATRRVTVADLRNLAPKLAGAKLKLLASGVDYEANFPGFALSWPRRKPGSRPEHNAWRYHRMVERLAGRTLPFDHRLSVPAAARAEAQRIRGDDIRPLVLTNANGAFEQRLSGEQVAALARGLSERGYRLLHLSTPGGGPTSEELRALEPLIETVDPSERLQGAALDDVFLALGEVASAYIGCDGGMGHLMATVMTPIVIVNRGFSIARWRPLSNCVEILEARRETSTGLVRDTPASVILAAADRLFAAQKRDHL